MEMPSYSSGLDGGDVLDELPRFIKVELWFFTTINSHRIFVILMFKA